MAGPSPRNRRAPTICYLTGLQAGEHEGGVIYEGVMDPDLPVSPLTERRGSQDQKMEVDPDRQGQAQALQRVAYFLDGDREGLSVEARPAGG